MGIGGAIMRVIRLFLSALILVVAHASAHAHSDWKYHYNDATRILNGFGADADYAEKWLTAWKKYGVSMPNNASPNAAKSTIEAEKAFSGFCELFNQVSGKMDSMPTILEQKFGLAKRTLQNPNHRFLCHGWMLDKDPPEIVLEMFQKKTGVQKSEFLNFWRHYQLETFAMAEKYTHLSPEKAKAYASFLWDIHLLGDWEPDSTKVKWLVPVEDIANDMCDRIRTMVGGDRAEKLCAKITEFVEVRRSKNLPTRHIALELKEWLTTKRIGDEIYMANKVAMKGVWNADIAININAENATIRIQKEIAEKAANNEAKRLAKEAKLKKSSSVPKPKEETQPLKVARDLKAQCKDAKLAKGFIPETMKPQKGYLVPITYKSGRKNYVLILKSSAVKAGVGSAVNAGTAVASGAVAGAAEGVCAFVISSGIAFGMYQYGAIDDEELKEEFAKAAMSAAVVGTIVAVTVILGASPYGFTVIAVGIAGYVVCDMVFTMIKQQTFTCDDILGYMDEEFEDTASFFTIGTQPSDTFINKKGKDSFVDEPELPTFIDFGSKGKSFIDFLEK